MSRMTSGSVGFGAAVAAAATPGWDSGDESGGIAPFAMGRECGAPACAFFFPALDGFAFEGPFFASLNA